MSRRPNPRPTERRHCATLGSASHGWYGWHGWHAVKAYGNRPRIEEMLHLAAPSSVYMPQGRQCDGANCMAHINAPCCVTAARSRRKMQDVHTPGHPTHDAGPESACKGFHAHQSSKVQRSAPQAHRGSSSPGPQSSWANSSNSSSSSNVTPFLAGSMPRAARVAGLLAARPVLCLLAQGYPRCQPNVFQRKVYYISY